MDKRFVNAVSKIQVLHIESFKIHKLHKEHIIYLNQSQL